MKLNDLLRFLDYQESPHYYNVRNKAPDPRVAHLFRSARSAGACGIYVFRASSDRTLPERPAVYIAEASDVSEAQAIHQKLWNLGQAPFLIVLLPTEVRIYTGFDYSKGKDSSLSKIKNLDDESIRQALEDFKAESINSGRLWRVRAKDLRTDRRVDVRLLNSLKSLGAILKARGIEPRIVHALIGKYIYISYLRNRKILSDEWLVANSIDANIVFGRDATVQGLKDLVKVLEAHFNGDVFPLDFSSAQLRDADVAEVASAFHGDLIYSDSTHQLHLEFDAYDFEYIPIETLSSIYEQFLHVEGRGPTVGAYYTPEPLADYLLAEVNLFKLLKRGMKVLDPSCGSGIFLVLAYRQLIEREMARQPDGKLTPTQLRDLLMGGFYGIERERDACYVAEFSLILTLLDYIDPPELHRNTQFKLPSLHNSRIFECDFFNDDSVFWKKGLRFDWIVGNPPWIELKPSTKDEDFTRSWLGANQDQRPVSGNRVSEAFSWRVVDLLSTHGVIGLILHAKSLVNEEATKYRKTFFEQHDVLRVTNLSNLRFALFGRRSIAPASTVIYRQGSKSRRRDHIIHYGPFLVNQTSFPPTGRHGDLWTITINENEVKSVNQIEAISGKAGTWKLALWGNNRDRLVTERLRVLFPKTLNDLCHKRGWSHPAEGPQLRSAGGEEGLDYRPEIAGRLQLDTDAQNNSGKRFTIPLGEPLVLKPIPIEQSFLRRGAGQLNIRPPHIFISASWNYVIYSEQDALVRPRQIRLSAPQSDSDYLRAIAAFLASSLVRYYLFFQVPDWGIERDRVTLSEVRALPVPEFTNKQARELAKLQIEIARRETKGENADDLQTYLDAQVNEILSIPDDISQLVQEFFAIRYTLNQGRTETIATNRPNRENLRVYTQRLTTELNDFLEGSGYHHQVRTFELVDEEWIACLIEMIQPDSAVIPVTFQTNDEIAAATRTLRQYLKDPSNQRFSQWVYIKRGLRIFDGPRIYIYKEARLIDWTGTQAMSDADDLIAEILMASGETQ